MTVLASRSSPDVVKPPEGGQVDDVRLSSETQLGPSKKTAPAIVVRKASRTDRPAIERFIEEAYGPRAQYKAPEHWTWQFIDNPFGCRQGDDVPVWVAIDGDRVVGQIAIQEARLHVEGNAVQVGWAVDIMILRSHRGSGVGHRLHDAVASEVDVLMSLSMADASRRLAEKHSCVTLAEVSQLTRWVRLDGASVQRYLLLRTARHRWPHAGAQLFCNLLQFHRLLPHLVNPILRLHDLVKRPRRGPSSTRIVEVDRFGSQIDALWERTRGDYPVIFGRDSQFLNWRFVDCPKPRYRCFVAERGGRAVGYVVLRRADPVELPQGIIADLYASREDVQAIDDLIRHSLAFFGNSVAAVDCGTSVPEFEASLRRNGFFRTRSHHPTLVCRDGALSDHLAQLKNDWFFSKGDHDWDQIYIADPSVVAE